MPQFLPIDPIDFDSDLDFDIDFDACGLSESILI